MTIAPLVRFTGNRQPPISGQILVDGAPPATALGAGGEVVTFYMRPWNSSTPLVSGGAVVVDSTTLWTIHYNLAAPDVATPGFYVGWWRVTSGGTFEETPEFLIQVTDHAAVSTEYVSVEELKTTRSIGKNYADADVRDAVVAASRFVDGYCNRSFVAAGASETRVYTALDPQWVTIDDAVTISAVTVGGTAIVQGTDFTVEVYNGLMVSTALPITAAVQPFVRLRALSSVANLFPRGTQNGVAVTGTFGWPAVPPEVKVATKILAARLVPLMREGANIGLGFDGAAVPLGLVDGAVAALLQPYERTTLVV